MDETGTQNSELRTQNYREGIRLFNAGEFWHAHEQWEACWLIAREPELTFYQGIIQAAAALVLEAPFTSMADMARLRYKLVPVDPLLKDRFESIHRIDAIDMPLLVMQGGRDNVVPPAMGVRLFDAATTKDRQFWHSDAAGHNDLAEHGAVDAGISFVTKRLAARTLAGL